MFYKIQDTPGKKTRSFEAARLCIVTANQLFPEGGGGKTIRPVYATFAGTETELRPFMANLRLGRKAEESRHSYSRKGDGERLEFLKSVGYKVSWQKEAEGSLATLYHPDLLRLDPGLIDPEVIQFVLLVPQHWEDSQKIDTTSAQQHAATLGLDLERTSTLATVAYLFAAYLDRRTRCPLVADGRFYLQLLYAALDADLASKPGNSVTHFNNFSHGWGLRANHGFGAVGLSYVNFSHAIAFSATHDQFEAFLAEQTELYFGAT